MEIKEEKKQLEEKFNLIVKRREEAINAVKEMDAELLMLRGEFRILEKMEKEVSPEVELIEEEKVEEQVEEDTVEEELKPE